jgi:hypothetical protein
MEHERGIHLFDLIANILYLRRDPARGSLRAVPRRSMLKTLLGLGMWLGLGLGL